MHGWFLSRSYIFLVLYIWDSFQASSFAKDLAKHDEIIHQINAYFTKNEKLVVGDYKETDLNEPTMKLSNTQFSCLMQKIQYFKTFEGKIVKLRRKGIGFVRKI